MAAIRDIPWRHTGEKASPHIHLVLTCAWDDGVRFQAMELRRTLERQWYFWNNQGKPGFNLAAYPSKNAPHIREGRQDHAADINALDGGAQRLAKWCRANGIRVSFPVPGEPWHMEFNAADLARFYRANHGRRDRRKLKVLTAVEKKWVEKRYFHYKGIVKYKGARTPKGKVLYARHYGYSKYYKSRIQKQMRALKADASKKGGGGWARNNRGERWQVLKAAYDHKLNL